jgi:hypothetical protein
LVGKQTQKVLQNSTAVQAGRDVNIGISYSDVKEIFFDLFKSNFPVLENKAKQNAQENVEYFESKVAEMVSNKIDEIDLNKFTNPNTQFMLNQSLQHAARKGKSGNLELLVESLMITLGNSNNEMLDIISEQALAIIPQITPIQIKIITLAHYLLNCNTQELKSIMGSEPTNLDIKFLIGELPENVSFHLKYLESLGVLKINTLQFVNIFSRIKEQYRYLYKETSEEEVKEDVYLNAPHLKELSIQFTTANLSNITLTPVGILISLINMKRVINVLDYKSWIF